jgi:two-component system cell cycle response regulator
VQGTILIIDGVSTNRIMLKVQLSAAWYHVVQSDRIEGVLPLIRRTMPDLIVTAATLPDGSAMDLHALLASERDLASIPILAITAQNDHAARLRALAAGIDDVLSQPIDDVMLQAQIRRLLRADSQTQDLHLHDQTARVPGLEEPIARFLPAPPVSRVALLTHTSATAPSWRQDLSKQTRHKIECYPMADIRGLMNQPPPDVVVLELPDVKDCVGMRLLADLRARSRTRDAIIIAIPNPANPTLAAEALDRGAHDVLPQGFCAQELSLRITAQLQRRAKRTRIKASVRDGLRAAMHDPMTGLYNRRYAMPQIREIARRASQEGQSFALMMVDLDHFKRVNDQFGHMAGDAVLIEAAHRLRATLRANDIIARIGGEEFMIALPNVTETRAVSVADQLCRTINDAPFHVTNAPRPLNITTSIGLAVGPESATHIRSGQAGWNVDPAETVTQMIAQADRALYAAKSAGRNQVTPAWRAA